MLFDAVKAPKPAATTHENRRSKIENRGRTAESKKTTNCKTADSTDYPMK
jgi:hypothetical protein